VRNWQVLRRTGNASGISGEDVENQARQCPVFSARLRRSWSGPSEVLRMIRSPYSYNLSFLKKTVMIVAPRSLPA
jgi:HD-like signal output (HDOD) protein